MNETKARPANELESGLLNLLLASDFQGAEALRAQIHACSVRTIDQEGSFQIITPVASKAAVKFTVPVELSGADTDGAGVHVLLHVVDGFATEVEIYKDSPTPISKLPTDWKIIVY
jgi:hypothetical protein